jgi:hypothetical protein
LAEDWSKSLLELKTVKNKKKAFFQIQFLPLITVGKDSFFDWFGKKILGAKYYLNEDNIDGPWKLHNDGWKYLTRNSYYRYDNYDNNCCFRRRKWVLIEKMPTKIEKLIFGYNFFSYDVQEITFI